MVKFDMFGVMGMCLCVTIVCMFKEEETLQFT